MAKQLLFKDEARKKLAIGIGKLADAVRVTMGPRGRNVLLDRGVNAPVIITKDGVSVARDIFLEDRAEDMGAQLVKDVANKTNNDVGDGTTTATVLTDAIVQEGLKYLDSGINAVSLKKALQSLSEEVIGFIKNTLVREIKDEDVERVATISANDPTIGAKIAEAIKVVGKTGLITVEQSPIFGLSVETVSGLRFEKGYQSQYMITNPEKMTAEYEDVSILVTDFKITTPDQFLHLFEKLVKQGDRRLVIIAEDIQDPALSTIVLNKMKGAFSTLTISAPSYGDRQKRELEDIAVLTGATFVSQTKGMTLSSVNVEDLGRARLVTSTKDHTTIVGGAGKPEDIGTRVAVLQTELSQTESQFDKEKIKERIGKLSGGVAVIKIGAASDVETGEIKHRIEDAIGATKAAIEEGIVPGGGMALLSGVTFLESILGKSKDEEEAIANKILSKALKIPARQIMENAGLPDLIKAAIGQASSYSDSGYDANTGEIVSMFEQGIVDPMKVTRAALENAVSIASMVLTTESLVIENKEKKEPIM